MKRLFLLLLFLPLFVALGRNTTSAISFGGVVNENTVVRAYFTDRSMVDYVASWKEPWDVNYQEGYMVFDVTPAEYAELESLGYVLEVDDKLTAAYRLPAKRLAGQSLDSIPGYPCYRTVEETLATAATIAAEHPDFASVIDIGDSWQKTQNGATGYDLVVLKLTNSAIPGPKPTIFIMSAVHAREYATAELNTRFAEYLIDNYGTNADATWLLDHHEFHFLLQSNPDGRKQAETGLSWRKNVNNNYCANSNTRGADLNRNFSFEWGRPGASTAACSDTYRGPSASSEPEVAAIQNYNLSIFADLRVPDLGAAAPVTTTGVFLDIHSYSELVLWPWGFEDNVNPITGNNTAFQTFGRKMAYFNNYTPQQALDLYPTSGTTDDFAYGELGVPAFTFEIGTSFFQGCGTFENTILPDNLQALLYMAKSARVPYQLPAGPEVVDLALANNVVTLGQPITVTAVLNDTRYNNSQGTEPTQNIAAGEVYVNTPDWEAGAVAIPVTAVDGSFNTKVEAVQLVLDSNTLGGGRHMLFMRGRDVLNNWGTPSAIFVDVIDPAIAPTVEGVVRDATTNLPIANATVQVGPSWQVTALPTGFYQTQVISGSYDLTATAEGYASQTVADIPLANGQTTTQDFALTPVCTLWEDDVEGGTNGWTTQNPWAITTLKSHSPTHSWTDSPAGNYGNNLNISLTSPIIDLTGASDVQLNFWQICDTEAGWDYCHVEISTNGTTWTEIATYDGNHATWEEVSLDASALDNQPAARIRFRLTTDTNTVDDGWYVDDVRLIGGGASCTVAPTTPTAAFTSTSPDTLGETTQFTNASSDATGYTWDFGDGSAVSNALNPSHTYTATGTFTVTLMATDTVLTDTVSHPVVIEPVELPAPTAAFSATTPVTLGQAAVFTNTSTNAISYTWDFGDGVGISTAVSPTYTYTTTGVFTVTLSASNGHTADVASHPITVIQPPLGLPFVIYLPWVGK